MRSLKEQIGSKCIHFNGLANKSCKKDITYESVRDKSTSPYKHPCINLSGFYGGNCEHCEFPSNENVEKKVKEITERQKSTIGNLIAVKKHYSETKEASGILKCEGCGGELHYAVATINGHTRATCKGCEMGWIE